MVKRDEHIKTVGMSLDLVAYFGVSKKIPRTKYIDRIFGKKYTANGSEIETTCRE